MSHNHLGASLNPALSTNEKTIDSMLSIEWNSRIKFGMYNELRNMLEGMGAAMITYKAGKVIRDDIHFLWSIALTMETMKD